MENNSENNKDPLKNKAILIILALAVLAAGAFYFKNIYKPKLPKNNSKVKLAEVKNKVQVPTPSLDFAAYDKKILEIANIQTTSSTATSSLENLWPVKAAYPNYGAILPFNRIVAYYGNLYSKGMGILGEYEENVMLDKLNTEVKKWQEADPSTPVIPALHYIAVVAQASPGKDNKYRARMPDKEIDKVLAMADKIRPAPFCKDEKTTHQNDGNFQSGTSTPITKSCGTGGIVFLDVQIGLSSVENEIPLLEKYLKLPNVHLGIDPEFAMHNNARPGTEIGTLDAENINFAAEFLAKIVKENNLPPKILIIHRFTKPMLTNSKKIIPLPEVQIVINMDGFGSQGSKLNTYKQYVYKEPIQFTGFKLFYKNDSANGQSLLLPEQLLKLSPTPSYIQYQ